MLRICSAIIIALLFAGSIYAQNIRPLHDRVVVRIQDQETTNNGGIVLNQNRVESNASSALVGEVLAVGSGTITDSGDVRALDVSVGDKVLFIVDLAIEVEVDGETLSVMREEAIIGVLEG